MINVNLFSRQIVDSIFHTGMILLNHLICDSVHRFHENEERCDNEH